MRMLSVESICFFWNVPASLRKNQMFVWLMWSWNCSFCGCELVRLSLPRISTFSSARVAANYFFHEKHSFLNWSLFSQPLNNLIRKLIILMYVAWSFIVRYSRGDVIGLPFKTYTQCYLIPISSQQHSWDIPVPTKVISRQSSLVIIQNNVNTAILISQRIGRFGCPRI